MRLGTVSFLLLLLVRVASAACPGPGCVGGGGPSATDGILMWTGVAAAGVTACVDGSACDQDGAADGVCTFPLQACLGSDVSGVTSARVTPAKLAGSGPLQAGIQRLAPGQCTAPGFAVAVRRSAGLGPIRPGAARVKVMVAADGKRDPDTLRLTCQPATPSFASSVQPILSQKCAVAGCHDAITRYSELDLSAGAAPASVVDRPSVQGGSLSLVTPASIKKSFLARKILNVGLKPNGANGALMPFGCPGAPPPGGCLDDAAIYTILAWIQSGAPNN